MSRVLSRAAAILALLIVPAVAQAAPILISGTGLLGSFTGTFDYDPSTFVIEVELTNTSAPDNGGFITAFVFNLPGGAVITAATLVSPDFEILGDPSFSDDVNGAPFGQFDIGASTGGSFEGGGPPSAGIAVGGTETFSIALEGTGLDGLSAADFLGALSAPHGDGAGSEAFVVRFRAFEDGGSDKVPNNGHTVPAPGSVLLLGLGMTGLATRRRFSRP